MTYDNICDEYDLVDVGDKILMKRMMMMCMTIGIMLMIMMMIICMTVT